MLTTSIIIVLICLFLAQTQSQWGSRQYVIEKDFFTGLKAGEFSIYDQSGRNLLYRLESRYAVAQRLELYAYPGKQLVASLRNSWSPWIYDAGIEVYDMLYNQWIPGKISQAFPGYRFRYLIQYGNRRLIMEHKALSLTTEFRDEKQPNYILAQFRMRLISVVWSNKYDLQVYTNEYPDAIYLLALAAYDSNNALNNRANQNQNG